MRTIKRSTRFKKDYKRESRGRHRTTLDNDLLAAVTLLVQDLPLPDRLRDHPLTREWKEFRDCHLKPDLLLLYWFPDADTLELTRLGFHSELDL